MDFHIYVSFIPPSWGEYTKYKLINVVKLGCMITQLRCISNCIQYINVNQFGWRQTCFRILRQKEGKRGLELFAWFLSTHVCIGVSFFTIQILHISAIWRKTYYKKSIFLNLSSHTWIKLLKSENINFNSASSTTPLTWSAMASGMLFFTSSQALQDSKFHGANMGPTWGRPPCWPYEPCFSEL